MLPDPECQQVQQSTDLSRLAPQVWMRAVGLPVWKVSPPRMRLISQPQSWTQAQPEGLGDRSGLQRETLRQPPGELGAPEKAQLMPRPGSRQVLGDPGHTPACLCQCC